MVQAFGSFGTGVTGTAATTTAPTAPASISAGDSLICTLVLSTGGTGGTAATPSTPAGWTFLGQGKSESSTTGTHQLVYGKIAVGSDTMPTFTSLGTASRWTVECHRYTGVPGTGLPTAFFGLGQNGTTNTSNPCTIVGTATAQWVTYMFSERSTTNASYAAITGLTQRGTAFGTGGGAVDLGVYDTNGTISGTIPNRTAVAGTTSSQGENCILIWPAATTTVVASRATTWDTLAKVAASTRATTWAALAVVAAGGATATYLDRFLGNGTTTQLVVSTTNSIQPAAGSVVAAIVVQEIASGSPSAGTITDTYGDTGGTAWALQIAQGGSAKAQIYTRKIGTGPSGGNVTWTGPAGSSQAREALIWAVEIDGVSSATPLQTASATGAGTGSLTVTFGSAPAASSLILSAFVTSVAGTPTPSGFSLIDQNNVGADPIGTVAFQASGASTSHSWSDASATHCAAVAIELPVASANRATSWNVAAPVVSSRPTTWGVGGTVVATRATTWSTLGSVAAATRATTWKVAASIVATRATTWNALAAVVPTRATSWAALATLSATRASTWSVLTTVNPASRATTWDALAAAVSTRATTWTTSAAIVPTRATTWTVRAAVVPTRATTWSVAKTINQVRATTWSVLVTLATPATRATTWNALATITPSSRATTWDALASLAASRATTWNVAGTLSTVVCTISTSWNVAVTVAATRPTTWTTFATASRSRATTWSVLTSAETSASSSWDVLGTVPDTSAATTWTVDGQITVEQATTWDVDATVSATRATSWAVLGGVSTNRTTSWAVLTRTAAATRATTWNVDRAIVAQRVTTWAVLGAPIVWGTMQAGSAPATTMALTNSRTAAFL